MSTGNLILDAALKYNALGLSVTACCSPDHTNFDERHRCKCKCPGKRPWVKWKELQEKTADVGTIKGWWRRHPNSNVGVVLGPVSGLVRVDVDGATGEARLSEVSGGDLPPTWDFSSGQNNGHTGRGLLYGIPSGVVLKTTTDRGACDEGHQELRFQAKGAQTVLPPSIHASGRTYEWKPGQSPFDMPLAVAPDWLVEKLIDRPAPADEYEEAKRENEAAEPYSSMSYSDKVALARDCLAALSPSRANPYIGGDGWVDVGMALHSVGDELLPDWIAFSRQSPKFKEGECETKWATFNRNGKRTLGSLVFWAEQDGWIPPWKRSKPEAKIVIAENVLSSRARPAGRLRSSSCRPHWRSAVSGSTFSRLAASRPVARPPRSESSVTSIRAWRPRSGRRSATPWLRRTSCSAASPRMRARRSGRF
jgi:hypothetical protein